MAQTLAQKILQAHTDEAVEQDGQIVQCRVSMVLANDITGPLAIESFRGMGAKKVFDRNKIALVMDHFTPQKDIDSANQVLISRKFAEEQGIVHYYEGGDCGVAGGGVCAGRSDMANTANVRNRHRNVRIIARFPAVAVRHSLADRAARDLPEFADWRRCPIRCRRGGTSRR